MATDGFASSGDGDKNRNEFRETAEDPQLPDPSILEDVLRETIASDADLIQPEQMEALRDVARRHATASFEIDPIGVGLAEAILITNYKDLCVSDEKWRAMSLHVAESLFEADNIRQRVRDFWRQLCESVR